MSGSIPFQPVRFELLITREAAIKKFEAMRPKLRGMARRFVKQSEIEDLLQDVAIGLLNRFRNCQEIEVRSFAGYIFRAIAKEHASHVRKEARGLKMAPYEPQFNAVPDPREGVSIDQMLYSQVLSLAIEDLPLKQRQACIFCDFEGLSYIQTAEAMHTTVAAMKCYLYKARQFIRQRLEEQQS